MQLGSRSRASNSTCDQGAVMKLQIIDQDEAARSAGEGAKEAEREQEKLGLGGVVS